MNLRTIASLLALSLTACASVKPVSGPLSNATTGVTLAETWSDISDYTQGQTPGSKVLTMDGPALNRLFVVGEIKPGQSIVRAASKEQPTPVLRSDLSFNEQVEFVADSIAAMGYFYLSNHHTLSTIFGRDLMAAPAKADRLAHMQALVLRSLAAVPHPPRLARKRAMPVS